MANLLLWKHWHWQKRTTRKTIAENAIPFSYGWSGRGRGDVYTITLREPGEQEPTAHYVIELNEGEARAMVERLTHYLKEHGQRGKECQGKSSELPPSTLECPSTP